MPHAARRLLERYVEAKDFARPQLAPEVFAPDVALTYSIATDAIAFPPLTRGLEGVTRTLISDFALRFSRCRTYYVCNDLDQDAQGVPFVPWLVVMRETGAAALRIGKGFYRWTCVPAADGEARATSLHIHIARMDPLPDPDSALLAAVHAALPYPWLPPATLRAACDGLVARSSAFRFLADFSTPLAPPTTR